MPIKPRLSPNHSKRTKPITLIVMHSTGPGSLRGILEWLTTPASKVSYHGLIATDGTYYQLVPDDRVAWHAGVGEWNGQQNPNQFSLGLSFVNPNDGIIPLTPQQIATAKQVVQGWKAKHPIEAVTTHAIIARPMGRKTDPNAPNFYLEDYA